MSDNSNRDAITSRHRRLDLTTSQEPFAAILGCSDSRVPVEIVFDQGLGDLFVIRVAGNIVAPSYPFMDTAALGYGRILLNAFGLLFVFIALGCLFVALSRRRASHRMRT